ncbi:Proteasome subunit alpha type-3, partial [Dufourea novaeangliae]
YDLSASQFSPDGRVFQVEYAQKAVENGGTVIGLRGEDGIVFAVEKIVTSKLYEPGTNKRIFNIDAHVGMAASGLISDAGQIAETARSEASSYRSQYGIPMKTTDRCVLIFPLYRYLIGKAKQSAKTEIEKLKLSEMSCNELVKEAARIIYLVHDELKDKQFELEMSWVGKHTNGRHERVPLDIKSEAEAKAKQAMAEDSDSDTEDM